ncbi:extensin family protein [Mesobaculum littorinae]|nr:extensin family protein [Mesobaculum littorinae]
MTPRLGRRAGGLRLAVLVSVLALAAGAGVAQIDPPETAPRPQTRPEAPETGADAPQTPSLQFGAPAAPQEADETEAAEPADQPEPDAAPVASAPSGSATPPDTAPAAKQTSDTEAQPDAEDPAADVAGQEAPAPNAVPASDGNPAEESETADADASAPEPPAGPPHYEDLAETEAEFAACTAVLDRLGATWREEPAVTDPADRDCGIARPVVVSEVAPGIALTPEATLRCDTALALADWVADVLRPAAARLPDRGHLTELRQGSAYVCRGRNGDTTQRASEHSFGNAIDIMALGFSEGDPLVIEPRERTGSLEESVQKAAQASACLYFTTVLGPGSNAAHDDHLHLDIKARNGGFRLCQ